MVSRFSFIRYLDCTLLDKSLFTAFKHFTSLLFQSIIWSLILDEVCRTLEPRAFINRKMNFFPTHTNTDFIRGASWICFLVVLLTFVVHYKSTIAHSHIFYPLCVILGKCKRVWRNELNTGLVMIVSGKFYPALMWVGSIEVGLIRFWSIGSETLPAAHQSFPWINPIAPVNLSIINIRRDVSPPNCFSQFGGGHRPFRRSFSLQKGAVGVNRLCMHVPWEYVFHYTAQV